MKPYKLIPALVLQSFSSSLAIRMKKNKTSDYNKYLRVNGNESLDFANKELIFGKTNTMRLLIKSYLGIIASKYATLLNIRVISKFIQNRRFIDTIE
jgi:hypothetical protein